MIKIDKATNVYSREYHKSRAKLEEGQTSLWGCRRELFESVYNKKAALY